MKIDFDKKIGLAFTLFMMITAPIFFYSNDTLKPTREELGNFYRTKFEADSIVSIIERKYPGKGNYNLFKVASKTNYFPILLESSNSKNYKIFKPGGIISKEPNSYDLILIHENNTHRIRIRNLKDEDYRMMGVFLPIGFFGLIFIIQIFIPNSFYEQRRKNNKQ